MGSKRIVAECDSKRIATDGNRISTGQFLFLTFGRTDDSLKDNRFHPSSA